MRKDEDFKVLCGLLEDFEFEIQMENSWFLCFKMGDNNYIIKKEFMDNNNTIYNTPSKKPSEHSGNADRKKNIPQEIDEESHTLCKKLFEDHPH